MASAIRNTRRSQVLKPVQLEKLRKRLSQHGSDGLASALADALSKMRASIQTGSDANADGDDADWEDDW